jgi:GNAT superfamily N-acetyltransferase
LQPVASSSQNATVSSPALPLWYCARRGAELDALFVEPHLWKHGIGRRLVDHVAEVARVRAASFLHVIGNPHAEGFYLACGFCVTGTVDTRFGVGLTMRRPL